MPRLLGIYLMAWAALAQIRQAQPNAPGTAARAGTGAIEGVVSDSSTQAAIRKVLVTLSGPIPMRAVSDGGGRFAFRELPAGRYWIHAWKPGYNARESALGEEPNTGVLLGEGEQRKNFAIELVPDSSFSGRIVNEEGALIRNCAVTAARYAYERNGRTLRGVTAGSAASENGGYRVNNLAPGRYYIFASCTAELPAAHPLLRRGDPRTPHETYLPQLYGGGLDPAGATPLTLGPGASLDQIDFQMKRVPAFTLEGSIAGGDAGAPGGYRVTLVPVNRLMRNLMMQGTIADSETHKFQIRSVLPGSYLLIAVSAHEGRVSAAQRFLEVGSAPPEPIEITPESGADLKGSVQYDSGEHPPLEHGDISLEPLEGTLFVAQPQGQVEKDGVFTLSNVLPGRWRVRSSLQGFVKSVSLGGQPVSPDGFPIVRGAVGPLRIVMGSKLADVQVEVAGGAPGEEISAAIFPEDLNRLGADLERAGRATGTGRIEFGGLAPGRYRVFAIAGPNPWPILQRPDWLQSLASRSVAIELSEDEHGTATVEIMPREELLRILDQNE